LAFSAAIFAGLWAGNELTAIILRAWWAMILFLILGALIGWMAQTMIDEHIKSEADRRAQEAQQPHQPDQEQSSQEEAVQ